MPSRCCLGGDLFGLARDAEARVADPELEVFAHPVALGGWPDREADLGGPA